MNIANGLYEVNLAFDYEASTADDFGVVLSNTKNETVTIGFDKKLNQFYIDRSNAGEHSFSTAFTGKNTAPRLLNSKIVKLQLLVDHSSIELFADDGSVSMTAVLFPGELLTSLQLYQQNGQASLQQGMLHQLKSVWK